ncbi:MAG TPA: AlpA family phage regulatory protein [Devosia sp.]|nr:AlpA family phage regulatory protein [Devosia sp.]
MEPVLISIRDVQAILGGISRTTLYRRINDQTLPGPVKIGHRSFWEREAILKAVSKILGKAEAEKVND